MVEDEALHLNPESLEKYFRLGIVSVFQLSTRVGALLEIDPASDQLRLFVPARGSVPQIANFERIRVDRLDGPGNTSKFRVIVDAREMHYAAYQLIESIVAFLREGDTLGHAVLESIADMKYLLANRARLTDEEETGLWGELLVVQHLIGRLGEEAAMRSWLGPGAAEHDFSFPDFEAEVKTTRGEPRRHYISSDLQLEVSPDRPLFLISIQMTLAGVANTGRTLPQMIENIRTGLVSCGMQFEEALRGIGYWGADADLYQASFQLRSHPRAYVVDNNFPAVTRSRLENLIPNLHLISDIRYRVDVGDLAFNPIPAPIDDFCEMP